MTIRSTLIKGAAVLAVASGVAWAVSGKNDTTTSLPPPTPTAIVQQVQQELANTPVPTSVVEAEETPNAAEISDEEVRRRAADLNAHMQDLRAQEPTYTPIPEAPAQQVPATQQDTPVAQETPAIIETQEAAPVAEPTPGVAAAQDLEARADVSALPADQYQELRAQVQTALLEQYKDDDSGEFATKLLQMYNADKAELEDMLAEASATPAVIERFASSPAHYTITASEAPEDIVSLLEAAGIVMPEDARIEIIDERTKVVGRDMGPDVYVTVDGDNLSDIAQQYADEHEGWTQKEALVAILERNPKLKELSDNQMVVCVGDDSYRIIGEEGKYDNLPDVIPVGLEVYLDGLERQATWKDVCIPLDQTYDVPEVTPAPEETYQEPVVTPVAEPTPEPVEEQTPVVEEPVVEPTPVEEQTPVAEPAPVVTPAPVEEPASVVTPAPVEAPVVSKPLPIIALSTTNTVYNVDMGDTTIKEACCYEPAPVVEEQAPVAEKPAPVVELAPEPTYIPEDLSRSCLDKALPHLAESDDRVEEIKWRNIDDYFGDKAKAYSAATDEGTFVYVDNPGTDNDVMGILMERDDDVVGYWDMPQGDQPTDGIVDVRTESKNYKRDKKDIKGAMKAVHKGDLEAFVEGSRDRAIAQDRVINVAQDVLGYVPPGWEDCEPVEEFVAPTPKAPAPKSKEPEKTADEKVQVGIGVFGASGSFNNTYEDDAGEGRDFSFDTKAIGAELEVKSESVQAKVQVSKTSGTEQVYNGCITCEEDLEATTLRADADWRVLNLDLGKLNIGAGIGAGYQDTTVKFGSGFDDYYPGEVVWHTDRNKMAEGRAFVVFSGDEGFLGSYLMLEGGYVIQDLDQIIPQQYQNDVWQLDEQSKDPFLSLRGQKVFRNSEGVERGKVFLGGRYGKMENTFHLGADEILDEGNFGHVVLGGEWVIGNFGNNNQLYINGSVKFNLSDDEYRQQRLEDNILSWQPDGHSRTDSDSIRIGVGYRW